MFPDYNTKRQFKQLFVSVIFSLLTHSGKLGLY